jgi:uncharacterized SAM-binding protein YcdF (DUF218 family)
MQLPLWLCLGLLWATWRAWAQPSARWRRLHRTVTTLALLACWVLSAPVVSNRLLASIESRWPQPSDAELQARLGGQAPRVLVLAGGWSRRTLDGEQIVMGGQTWERTWAGIGLVRRLGGDLLVSGAPLRDGSDSVARHMAELALATGLPPARVRVEQRSTSTRENLAFSDQAFGLRQGQPVVLVTSALHMRRAVASAQAIGLKVLPYPCDYRADLALAWQDFLPSNAGPEALEEVLHEWLGYLTYALRGWAEEGARP